MQAFRFLAGRRELACVLHEAQGELGVLMCNPFGQEAVRVHRLQRVIAERLARNGSPVLRFDWYGTGESMGDDSEGDLAIWQQDLLAADQRLRDASGCKATIWVGMRLGATLAVLACAEAKPAPIGLVLWEPVTNGDAYLDSLQLDHERALDYAYGPLRRDADVPESNVGEAIGFSIGDRLSRQLSSLTLFGSVLRSPSVVIAPPDHPALRWTASGDVRPPRAIPFEHEFDWNAEEALNTALVPADAVKQILAGVEALR